MDCAITVPMVRIDTEQDIEQLRRVARLLDAENARLHKRLVELTRLLRTATGEHSVQLELELGRLQDQLARINQDIYGASSEKRGRGDGDGDGDGDKTPKEKKQRKGHGPTAQPTLPSIEIVYKLDPADETCPKCGDHLEEWEGQFESSDEVDVVERSFRIVRHQRQKSRCECGHIETALGPPKLLPGGRYSVEFGIAVAVDKFGFHMPLSRQEKQMRRQGLLVSSQTLWDQIFALARHLEPSYEALREYVLGAAVIGVDETTWRLMEKKSSKKWWVWTICREDAVFHAIHPHRSTEAARVTLDGFTGDTIVVDGYYAYPSLLKSYAENGLSPPFQIAACWVHGRRGFHKAAPDYPIANELLDLIAKLYEIEGRVADLGGDERRTRLAELRRLESAPIVAEIKAWLRTTPARKGSSLGLAIHYMHARWPALEVFLGRPDVPIDNLQTERLIRPIAVGRKNHYGSRSQRGTFVAALFYTMIESAELAGIDPGQYLKDAALRAIANPGTVTLPQALATTTAAQAAA
jgi:transposase